MPPNSARSESTLEELRKRLTEEEYYAMTRSGGLTLDAADKMTENVIGLMHVPVNFLEGFLVNGQEFIVPIATEEREVPAMARRGADLTRSTGGFWTRSTEPIMIGQIQVVEIPYFEEAERRVLEQKTRLLEDANTISSTRKAVDLRERRLETAVGPMLIVEILVDVKDSMGANLVDSMCELIAPTVEALTGGRVNMRILSNLATERLVTVDALVPKEAMGGEGIIDRVVDACAFASTDPYRATTHNKGIMNGVSAVLIATSNDSRAVEAGAHAYAAMKGAYRPLSTWTKTPEGDLRGYLEMPLSAGVVGGSVSAHPAAMAVLKILGVKRSTDLAEIAGALGLSCNLGALFTLVTDGIKSIKP
jgi:hydroxymethylglutaryl-CoA reductase